MCPVISGIRTNEGGLCIKNGFNGKGSTVSPGTTVHAPGGGGNLDVGTQGADPAFGGVCIIYNPNGYSSFSYNETGTSSSNITQGACSSNRDGGPGSNGNIIAVKNQWIAINP